MKAGKLTARENAQISLSYVQKHILQLFIFNE